MARDTEARGVSTLSVYLSASRLEMGDRPVVCILVTDLSADKRRGPRVVGSSAVGT